MIACYMIMNFIQIPINAHPYPLFEYSGHCAWRSSAISNENTYRKRYQHPTNLLNVKLNSLYSSRTNKRIQKGTKANGNNYT